MVPLVYLTSVCQSLQCLISALTQAGRGGLLFRLLLPLHCGEGLVLLSPSTLLRLQAVLYEVCPALCAVPALVCSTKHGTKSCACFLCLPHPSGSGSQELDGHTLPRCGTPSPLRIPSPSPSPCLSGACTLCLATTLPADVDHPESQEVFGLNLEACLQCGRGCGPWGRACPFPLPPASCLQLFWAPDDLS